MRLQALSQKRDGFAFIKSDHPVIRIFGVDSLVGTGERFDMLDFLGHDRTNEVKEVFTHQGSSTYLPIPLVLSRTVSFLVDTRRTFTFHSRKEGNDALVEIDGELDPEDSVLIYQGPVKEALAALLRHKGGVCLPPSWIFGQWASANRWKSTADVLEAIDKAQRHGFDLSVLVIEAFSDESTFYRFNEESQSLWADRQEMMRILKNRGIHLLLWQCPVFKALEEGRRDSIHEADLLQARKEGLEVRLADGSPYRIPKGHWFAGSMIPDFTSKRTRDWWMSRRKALLDMGISGFKTDGGEFVLDDGTVFSDGSTGKQMRNAYCQSYVGTYLDYMSPDCITFSRAGYLGSQRTSVYWAGDQLSEFSELESAIRAGLNASMCGVFWWGFDLAGFAGPMPSKELYLRSYEAAAFVPVMQWHSEPTGGQFALIMASTDKVNDRSPWNMASLYGDEVLEVTRRYSKLRTALRAYLESEASHCQQSCEPLMRSMFYETEGQHASIDDQFLLGRSLLVAPILHEGQYMRSVILPQGSWWDVLQALQLEGPCTVQRSYSLDQIGLFIRINGPNSETLEFLKD